MIEILCKVRYDVDMEMLESFPKQHPAQPELKQEEKQMKKLIAMLLAVVMVIGLAACGGNTTTTETKAPTATEAPGATEAKTATPAAAGSVYYLNFKPEFDEALPGLAATYREKTGVPVKVVTAASGDYSTTLNAQMGKDGAPTIYNIGTMSGLRDWDVYALDLTGTPQAGELTTNDFNH